MWFFDRSNLNLYNNIWYIKKSMAKPHAFIFYKKNMQITHELIQEFTDFYLSEWYKTNTLKRFSREFSKFSLFIKERGVDQVEQITIPIIEAYKTHYLRLPVPKTSRYFSKNNALSPKTIEEKIQTIKNFLIFTNYKYEIWLNPQKVRIPRSKSKRMDFFTYPEILKILDTIKQKENYPINRVRLQLIVLIGFTTGLRLAEIMSLKVHQIMSGEALVSTKWDKERIVYFSSTVQKLLQEYLSLREEPLPWIWRKSRNKSDVDWVIISHHDKNFWQKCVKSTICRQFTSLNAHLNFADKKLSCHTLRHSCATYLLDKGVNLRYIQEILGHAHLSTTQTYLHIHNTKLKEIHQEVIAPIKF